MILLRLVFAKIDSLRSPRLTLFKGDCQSSSRNCFSGRPKRLQPAAVLVAQIMFCMSK